jgi:hypothetical protein
MNHLLLLAALLSMCSTKNDYSIVGTWKVTDTSNELWEFTEDGGFVVVRIDSVNNEQVEIGWFQFRNDSLICTSDFGKPLGSWKMSFSTDGSAITLSGIDDFRSLQRIK